METVIFKPDHGFTLIEVIISIALLGILALFMSIGVTKIIEGFLFTRGNADTALKAQMALSRLSKEFCSIDGISSGSKTAITYSYYKNDYSVNNRTVSWSGTANAPLLLGGNMLTGEVQNFELSYHNSYVDVGDNTWNGTEKMITITLELTGGLGQVSSFSLQVIPRNL